MLTPDQAHDLFHRVEKFSSADEVELHISGGHSALTRFANNTILQNVADENYDISVRVQFEGKTARASTNRWDDESLRQVVKSAEDLAIVQEHDDELLPMFSAANERLADAPSRYFDETAAIGPAERAREVAHMVEVARREKLNSAGVYASNTHVDGVFNSRGVSRWYRQTFAEASVTMTAANSSGWQKANSPDARAFNARQMAEIAAEKARRSDSAVELDPGKYTVILEPSAVLDIVGFIFWDFGGTALLEQRSFLNNRMGKKLFGENISIIDDVRHPLQCGPAWDGEGVARERVELVHNGVVGNVVYSRGSAAKAPSSEVAHELVNAHPTGHGFPLPNEIGEVPMNIVFEVPDTESKSIDEMIASTERGILVTRFWYIREVEPYEKIVTGMTRDGTFLIENGKISRGIRNFRFNESLVQMLNNVEMLGRPVRASGEESFDMVVPAMKVREFNFTEVTKF